MSRVGKAATNGTARQSSFVFFVTFVLFVLAVSSQLDTVNRGLAIIL